MNPEIVKKPIHFDEEIWNKLQAQAEKFNTTPSKALDFVLRRYYKLVLEAETNNN